MLKPRIEKLESVVRAGERRRWDERLRAMSDAELESFIADGLTTDDLAELKAMTDAELEALIRSCS